MRSTLCAFGLSYLVILSNLSANDDFFSRDHLFGDPGRHRTYLAEHGFIYDFVYTGEYFWNLDGGIDEGDDYLGDLSLYLELDTEQAGWWENGQFFVQLQSVHGKGITERFVGDFQVFSNIDADEFSQVSEFWYKHTFFDERFFVKVGKMEANEDFAFVDYGGEFINSSPGFSPTIPLVTFPDQDWGIVLGYDSLRWFSMNLGVYQGNPDGNRSIGNTLDNLEGPMMMIEPAFHYEMAGHPGHFRIGGWWNGREFDRYDANNPTPDPVSENYGLYLTWDQEVWAEDPEEEDDEQGIGVFAQYGYTPAERSEAEHYVGAGMQWIGAIPTRDEDVIGAGVFHVAFSDEAGFVDSSETAFELFYKYQAMGWLSIKPEIQYILNPGGSGNDDAFVFGLRWEVVF